MKLVKPSKSIRDKIIKRIYHEENIIIPYRIQKRMRELGYKPPHKHTVKKVIEMIKTNSIPEIAKKPVIKKQPKTDKTLPFTAKESKVFQSETPKVKPNPKPVKRWLTVDKNWKSKKKGIEYGDPDYCK